MTMKVKTKMEKNPKKNGKNEKCFIKIRQVRRNRKLKKNKKVQKDLERTLEQIPPTKAGVAVDDIRPSKGILKMFYLELFCLNFLSWPPFLKFCFFHELFFEEKWIFFCRKMNFFEVIFWSNMHFFILTFFCLNPFFLIFVSFNELFFKKKWTLFSRKMNFFFQEKWSLFSRKMNFFFKKNELFFFKINELYFQEIWTFFSTKMNSFFKNNELFFKKNELFFQEKLTFFQEKWTLNKVQLKLDKNENLRITKVQKIYFFEEKWFFFERKGFFNLFVL